MEVVKAFNSNNLHTEIVIKGTINEPLFRAGDVGTVLEMGNIRTSINDFNDSEKVVHTMDTLGGSQQVTFLTEKGLYKVLFKSRKPIAEKFQNWVCEVIKEIRLNGVYDLQKQLLQVEDKKKQEYETKLEKQKVIEREKILLKEYGTIGAVFYVIKVKTYENTQYVIKVGESRRGITDRYKEHKSKYEECLLLDCFTVNKSKDFETFIKEHDLIRPNKVKNLQGHETELELFLIGKNLSYQTLINIVTNNIKYFNNNDNSKLELENEQLKLMLEMKTTNNDNVLIQELIKTIKDLSHKVDVIEKSNKEMLNKLTSQETKIVTGFNEPLLTVGPRLQKINPETMLLIKVYESVSEVMKEDSNIKRPSVNKAIVENTILYSEPLDARYLDGDGQEQVIVMGSYGIGPARVAMAAIEQGHDDDGIIWPAGIAPFDVHIVLIGDPADPQGIYARDLWTELSDLGLDVLLDDRPGLRPGEKFAEADLLGCPLRVTVGKRTLPDGPLEVQERRSREKREIPLEGAAAVIRALWLGLADG